MGPSQQAMVEIMTNPNRATRGSDANGPSAIYHHATVGAFMFRCNDQTCSVFIYAGGRDTFQHTISMGSIHPIVEEVKDHTHPEGSWFSSSYLVRTWSGSTSPGRCLSWQGTEIRTITPTLFLGGTSGVYSSRTLVQYHDIIML